MQADAANAALAKLQPSPFDEAKRQADGYYNEAAKAYNALANILRAQNSGSAWALVKAIDEAREIMGPQFARARSWKGE